MAIHESRQGKSELDNIPKVQKNDLEFPERIKLTDFVKNTNVILVAHQQCLEDLQKQITVLNTNVNALRKYTETVVDILKKE